MLLDPRPQNLSGGGVGGGEGMVECGSSHSSVMRALRQDAWRTRVKASESLHSSKEPGPGSSVFSRGAAERTLPPIFGLRARIDNF